MGSPCLQEWLRNVGGNCWWSRSAATLLFGLMSSASSAMPSQYLNGLQAANYSVYSADINGDGYPDLLLKAKNGSVLINSSINFLAPLRARASFAVLSSADGSYSILLYPSPSVLNNKAWVPDTHELIFGDTDGDGSLDMLVRAKTPNNVSVLITGSNVDGAPKLLQRLKPSDLNGTDLGTKGLNVDLVDVDNSRRAGLVIGKGVLIQSIYRANSNGMLSAQSSSIPATYSAKSASVAAATPAAVAATVAGATRGAFNVSADGSAVYDIPVWVPSGPNGVQPNLSIHYDSSREFGTMGPGWSVSGLGAIYRCNMTFAQDAAPAAVALATGDGYCIDGKRLRLTGGTYGTANSTYGTELADFSQVTAYGSSGNGPAYFYAQRKDGLIYEYGNTSDSRITASGSSTPYQWRLNKVRDRNGNNYAVTYGTGQSGSGGIGVPVSIYYTPTSSGSTSYRYKVLFTYMTDTADGTEVGYVAGGSTINNNLLTSVKIQRIDVSKALKTYNFGYQLSPTTNRNRLISVQECSDENSANCLSPTAITYQNGVTGVATTASTAVSSVTAVAGTYDFNGDGLQDILYTSGGAFYVAFGTTSGFGAPINTGITLASGDMHDAGDLVGSGKDDILVTRNRVWYRYYWNGSAFTGVSSGVSLGSDETTVGTTLLADINGDGLPDLLTRYSGKTTTGSVTQDTFIIYSRLNTSTNGVFSLSSTRTTATSISCPPNNTCTAAAFAVSTDRRSAREKLDFDGDGRQDVYLELHWLLTGGAAAASPSGTNTASPSATGTNSTAPAAVTPNAAQSGVYSYSLVSKGTTLSVFSMVSQTVPAYASSEMRFANWNDDACTDVVYVSQKAVHISACNGIASQTLPFTENFLGIMDWNGDGRADLLVNSGGNIGVRLSTGGGLGALTTTTIPVPSNPMVFDQNGDGLDDLADVSATSPYPVTYRLHNGAGQPPDLATSITDGFGIAFNPTYTSIVQGNYAKASGASAPERDVQRAMYVVNQYLASDGIGGTYTKTYFYSGAREDMQGRGFSGFQSITASDSRTTIPIVKTYYKTAFPYTGLSYQQDAYYQSSGTVLVSHDLNIPATTTLSNTVNQQRYFPYVASASRDSYEVGGSKNGLLIAQKSASFTFDNYGNVISSSTTVTDKDSAAPQSPTYNQSWTTTVSNTITPNTANWCLGVPTQTTVTRSASGVSAITRTTGFTPDYVKCRITQSVVEPSSSTYKVTTDYGYDSFGNRSSQTVTGVGMAARTTTISWGTTGQFPISVTDPLNQISQADYDYNYDVRISATDPNKLKTSWVPDDFGRVITETRPDGTSTSYSYKKCADVSGGCKNGDPGNSNTSLNKTVVIATLKDTGGTALRDDSTYLDQLDRPIVTLAKTLTGTYSRTGTQYDQFGRTYRQTAPCVDGNCVVYWTTNSYDALNRLIQQSRPVSVSDSSTQSTTLSYLGMTTVVTDAQSKTTTKSVDPNGWLRQSKDNDGYFQTFAYDAFGSVKAVTDSQSNNLFSANYDYGLSAFRRQTTDMDLGTWAYTPNALGEVGSYSDANSNSFSLTYDKLSRPLTRFVSGEGTTTWTWGSTAASYNIGKLQSVVSTGGTTENYTYDNKGRLSQRQIVSDATYNYDLTYSSTTGFLDTLTYPTSTSSYRLKLQYGYQNGMLQRVSDFNASGTVFWQGNAMNARGQITQETLGNGIVTSLGFDAVTGWLSSLGAGVGGGTGVQNESYGYDKLGNVAQRQNLALNLKENFYYDNLYRLDYSQLNGTTNLDLSYDPLGNITKRCEPTCGSSWTYDSTKKHAVTQASIGSTTYTYGYDLNGNVNSRNGNTITWSKYNYPTLINGSGESVSLSYDANFQRWKQVDTLGGVSETTIYAGGLLEKVMTSSSTDWRHLIYANGKTVALVSRTSAGVNTTRYVLEDHQGSVSKFTSSSGAVTVGESFTAFGARRDPGTWSGSPSSSDLTTINGISRQGYTGQTALGNLGLNHMNGRVQDALTGRFLSADPFVAGPGNTQGFNRYSYVNNNPLSFVDPSGFEGDDIDTIYVDGTKNLGNDTENFGGSLLSWVGHAVSHAFSSLFGGSGGKSLSPAEPVPETVATNSADYAYYDPALNSCGSGQPCDVEDGSGVNSFVKFMGQQPTQPSWYSRGGPIDLAIGKGIVWWGEEFLPNAFLFAAGGIEGGLGRLGALGGAARSTSGAASGVAAIATPLGDALQSTSVRALAARAQVAGGATLWRMGALGKSAAAEGQFWALENPLSVGYARYADRYGIPAGNVANFNFIESAVLRPGTSFVTRDAPGVGANLGGGIEAVVPEGGVTLRYFSTY